MPVATQGTVKSLSPGRSPRGRRPDRPRQHLPPAPAPGPRAGARARRPASLHGLGRADPDRLRRLPGLQPLQAAAASARRASSSAPTSTARSASLTPESVRGDPARARRRHHPPARRVPRASGHPRAETERSLALTLRWLRRAVAAHRAAGAPGALFGIVQGGTYARDCGAARWRRPCALDLPGYAIGGLAVGEPKPAAVRHHRAGGRALLPADRPRYLMGVGKPGGPGRGGGARRRPLRLRAADAQRAQRPGLHRRTARSPSATRASRATPRRSTPSARARRAAASRAPTCATSSSPRELLGYRLLSLHNLHLLPGAHAADARGGGARAPSRHSGLGFWSVMG